MGFHFLTVRQNEVLYDFQWEEDVFDDTVSFYSSVLLRPKVPKVLPRRKKAKK